MSSSSYTSDSEAGQEVDPEPPKQEPKQEQKQEKQKREQKKPEKLKPEKVTTEIAQPIPSPEGNANQVVKKKLSKSRREEIIKEFQNGKEDPEYTVKEISAGKYRLTKRKTLFTLSLAVESPKDDDVLSRFKREYQEELKQHKTEYNEKLETLRKKYKKFSAEYKPEVTPFPRDPIPPPVWDTPVTPHVSRKKTGGPVLYKRKKIDIRDY
jgi:hypothetical protein